MGRMPVPFEAMPDELTGLRTFLDAQRAALLRKIEGLTDEQAMSTPTSSDFSLLTLVKHIAFVERRWFQLEIARRDIPGLWPPPDDRELHVEPGDSLESIRSLYETTIAENQQILDDVDDLDSLSPATGLNRRWVLLHLIEELARHAGHADIIRETLDGTTGP
jgi:uncharacterized damage-inducible protein DinB